MLPAFGESAGFTLVELLVVIVILAILGVAGMTIFTGVTKKAENAKRKADIQAIAKAYEANYLPLGGYQTLVGSMFADGVIPKLPNGYDYPIYFNNNLGGFRACIGETGGSCSELSATCYCKESTQGLFDRDNSSQISSNPPPPEGSSSSPSPSASASSLPSSSPSPSPSSLPLPSPSPSSSPNSCNDPVLASGLVNYWNLDQEPEPFTDSAGGSNASGSTTTQVAGKINSARYFAGTSGQYLSTGSFAFGLSDPNTLTISAWVSKDDFATTIRRSYFSATGTGAGMSGGLSIEIGNTVAGRLSVIIPGIFVVNTTTAVITDANFHHIVYVRRGAGATNEVWVDNSNRPLNTNLTNSFVDVNDIKLLGGRTTTTQLWKGRIDEVGVWNRALSTAEIATLFNSGNGCVP